MVDTYTQETGTTLDFGLGPDETYTQASGTTLDFDLTLEIPAGSVLRTTNGIIQTENGVIQTQ